MLNICSMYSIGLKRAVMIINIAASILDILHPAIIGSVLAFSILSPSTSSMSFVISRANVMKNAKNPNANPV